jgi:ribosomal protein L28
MAKVCIICNKGYMSAQNIKRKEAGSWALKAPRTKRRQYPNLRTYRVDGKLMGMVCMKCYKKSKSE